MNKRTQFIVVDKISNDIEFNDISITEHWKEERISRHNKIRDIIGDGHLLASFEVDTAHPNGNEIHNIFSNGIILIQNIKTRKLVTELIARPQQLKRYWEGINKEIPSKLYSVIEKARENQKNGYNNW